MIDDNAVPAPPAEDDPVPPHRIRQAPPQDGGTFHTPIPPAPPAADREES